MTLSRRTKLSIRSSRYYLVGSGTDEPIELPEEIYQVLRQAVDAMQKGLSVTISPTSQTLTTPNRQQICSASVDDA